MLNIKYFRFQVSGFKILIFLSLLLTITISSCEFLLDPGEKTSRRINIDEFSFAHFKSIFNIKLVQDDSYFIKLDGYKSMIEDVKIDQQDGNIHIKNDAKLTWISNTEKPTLELHFKNINRIRLHSPCNVISSDTIKVNSLSLDQYCDISTFDITMDVNSLQFHNVYTASGTAIFRGRANGFTLVPVASVRIEADKLKCKNVSLTTRTINDVFINVTEKLDVKFQSKGDVYVKGSPEITISEQSGSGKIVYLSKE